MSPAGRVKWAHVDQVHDRKRKLGEVGDVTCGGFICSTRSKKERWAGFRLEGDAAQQSICGWEMEDPAQQYICRRLVGRVNKLTCPIATTTGSVRA